MSKNDYVFYRTKNGHIARFNPNKPWGAMDRKGKIVKKTIEIPKIKYSDEEPEYEEGYKKESRQDEIKTAKFIQGTLKKKVRLVKEKPNYKLNPDAIVEDKYVDFKNPKPDSKNGIDSLTRHGLDQINYFGRDKAGFVFHDADSLKQNKSQINKQVIGRMVRSKNRDGYVIVKKKNKLIVYRKK